LDSTIILKNIFFEFNKADLLPASFNELQKLHDLMVKNATLKIKIEGHTDNHGNYEFNLQLSKKRAESVVLYLINKGISSDRMESAGFSYAIPVASNDTPEGRQLNRRVAFKIISK
jgi:outer membrane protein OmpA-like peptidoglycan-associated protein